jgi:Ca2+-binding EF-hand superfamily protein
VDLFEYQLGFILVSSQNPNMIMSYLFKIFDSDKNGLLSQAEVINVLNTFFSLIVRNNDDGTQEKPNYSLEEIKNDIINAFGDKTEISQKELFEVCEKSPIIQDFGTRLQTVNMVSMLVGDCNLQ